MALQKLRVHEILTHLSPSAHFPGEDGEALKGELSAQGDPSPKAWIQRTWRRRGEEFSGAWRVMFNHLVQHWRPL